MMVTPEFIRVEMDYRLEHALSGDELAHVRAARSRRRPWWRRVFGYRTDEAPGPVNQVRPAL
ncbi:hypothetical protein [Actinophytocola sediminis]